MKKTLLAILVTLAPALLISGQTRPRYVFDNFSSGAMPVKVPVNSKMSKVLPARDEQKKNGVKKTVQSSPALSKKTLPMPAVTKLSATAARGSANFSQNFTTGDAEIDGYILDSCARYRIDPLLIYAQMKQESSFKLKATSYKGASGLMQLMPATARRFGVTSIYDPQQNIEAGVKYMRWLLNTFEGDVSLALAGYNAGEGAVMKYGRNIPPYAETQDYVRKINARYASLKGTSPLQTERRVYSTTAKEIENREVVRKVTRTEEVKKAPPSISLYDNGVYAVRTSDGKVRVVNQ